jgi:uncharacterized protein with NAD-binding domain and iron-sulfur cluster
MAGEKVIILGGGVAGLTAAHELSERGFAVEVYEKAAVPGGKAKSTSKPNSGIGTRRDLAGEHGFRFFPGFYQHIPDTMRRIPLAGNENGVFDNLVVAQQAAIAQEKKPLYGFLTHVPKTLLDWGVVLEDWFGRGELGLKPGEADYFISCLLDFMSTCEKRRLAKLEREKWWDYVGASSRSVQYRKLLAEGMTRSLVAMDAEVANSRTVGSILVQMIMSITSQSGSMDRVLNAPTSDAWISPWVTYLTGRGVKIFPNAAVQRIEFDGARITGVVVEQPIGAATITGDYYLAAFPVEVAQTLFAPFAAAAPSLGRIMNLQYAWMNGLVFYLSRDVPVCPGHIICADSPWAVTCISQAQFWSGVDLSNYGDGRVRGQISIDISNWTNPGCKVTPKPANQCTQDEIIQETWTQLVDHLKSTTDPLLPSDLVDSFLDPSISFPAAGVVANSQPLLINTINSWVDRPNAATEVPNLFLASDYVRTNTDLATMEGANEAARRAVNEILTTSNSDAAPCGVWEFAEPDIFKPLKDIDEILFDLGLPFLGHNVLRKVDAVATALHFKRGTTQSSGQ